MPVIINEFEAIAEPAVKSPPADTATATADHKKPVLEADEIRPALAMLVQRTLRCWAH